MRFASVFSTSHSPDGLLPNLTTHPRLAEQTFHVLHDYPSPELERSWREFLGRIDSPGHYDAPEFFREPYWNGKKPFAVLAMDHDRVIGVLTGLHGAGEIACGLPSRPQIQVDESSAIPAGNRLVQGLLLEADHEDLISVFSWAGLSLPGFEYAGFLRREFEGDVVLDLHHGAKAVFQGFHPGRRRNIRLAERNGIEVSESTTPEDLAAYWKVYSTWRLTERKKILHNHSFETIQQIHGMRGNHRRFLARYRGQVIAATGVRFLPGGLLEYANNCSLDEFLNLFPNDLLLWKTVQWACEQGFKKYSMGGAHSFLRRSGGTVVPICRYRLDRSFLHHHDLQDKILRKVRSMLH